MKKWCILVTPETREYVVRWAKSFFHYSEAISEHWKYFYSEEVNRISAPKFFSGIYMAEEYPLISFEEFKLLINTNNTNTINNYEIY